MKKQNTPRRTTLARVWSRNSNGGEKVSEFPKSNMPIRPATKALLMAASTVEARPMWRIVEDGIGQYVAAMPPADRKMVELFAQHAGGEGPGKATQHAVSVAAAVTVATAVTLAAR